MSTQALNAPQAFDYIATVDELNDRGMHGEEIQTLLEVQDQGGFFDTNYTLLNSQQPWQASKPVLHLKYEMQSSFSNEEFDEFQRLATVGLEGNKTQNVLYAQIEFHDRLRPDQAPIYLAATVHLGAMSHNEDWCDANSCNAYLVLECASTLYGNKSANDRSRTRAAFKYRGHDYRYQVKDQRITIYSRLYGEWKEIIEGVIG